jgi:hypothetical protein
MTTRPASCANRAPGAAAAAQRRSGACGYPVGGFHPWRKGRLEPDKVPSRACARARSLNFFSRRKNEGGSMK